MKPLIEELKHDHTVLSDKLIEIHRNGIISPESKKILFECKELLLEHLKKEDERLYPPLKKEAASNIEVMSMVKRYIENMEKISKGAIQFFEKYESSSEGTDFTKDLAKLLATLTSRIRKEEMILYVQYEELVTENPQ